MLNPSGPPGRIVDLLRSGALEMVVDDRILSEYTDVLRPDEGDAPFLEIALTEGIPLITGNLKHYPESERKGRQVLTPRQFIDKYPMVTQ